MSPLTQLAVLKTDQPESELGTKSDPCIVTLQELRDTFAIASVSLCLKHCLVLNGAPEEMSYPREKTTRMGQGFLKEDDVADSKAARAAAAIKLLCSRAQGAGRGVPWDPA